MSENLKEEELICILTNKPFSLIQTPPIMYIQSDGGHGGMSAINFCPWCGEKIEISN